VSAGDGAPHGVCRYSKCGKALPKPPIGYNIQERFYCDPTCRSRAHHEREGKRPSRAKARHAHVCEYPPCGKIFAAVARNARFCSAFCHDREFQRNQRANLDTARRHAAERTALRRKHTDACPGCCSPLGAEGPLLYCSRRCGWLELLTARERDPRADTDAPDPDPDQEDAEPVPPAQEDAMPTPDDAPAPAEPLPFDEQVWAVLDEPSTIEQLTALTYLPRRAVVWALHALYKARRVQVLDGVWSRWEEP
jgi:hypothetical protein